MQIKINDKTYSVEEAHSDLKQREGLSNVTELDKDKGMIFFFDPPQEVSFTMQDTKIPLVLVFADEDQEIVQVEFGEAKQQEPIISKQPVSYVIELHASAKVFVGDELEFEDDSVPVMKVLAQDGSTQMELWGGERIFSRKNTEVLIRKAKKAEQTQEDKDFRALGRYIFKCIKKQDSRTPEYVDVPS